MRLPITGAESQSALGPLLDFFRSLPLLQICLRARLGPRAQTNHRRSGKCWRKKSGLCHIAFERMTFGAETFTTLAISSHAPTLTLDSVMLNITHGHIHRNSIECVQFIKPVFEHKLRPFVVTDPH